jgi:mannosyl-3-phosphoglycerate phosphatase
MTTTPKLVIFSDLDGTLLDRDTYSFEPARPALRLIKERDIPLVLSSSKTRAEIELHRRRLENHHPFTSENGGGVRPSRVFFFSLSLSQEIRRIFCFGIRSLLSSTH